MENRMEETKREIELFKFKELNKDVQESVINSTIDRLIETTDFSKLNHNSNMYKAYKRSVNLKTPWFLGQFIWEYCEKAVRKMLNEFYYDTYGTPYIK